MKQTTHSPLVSQAKIAANFPVICSKSFRTAILTTFFVEKYYQTCMANDTGQYWSTGACRNMTIAHSRSPPHTLALLVHQFQQVRQKLSQKDREKIPVVALPHRNTVQNTARKVGSAVLIGRKSKH